MLSCSTTVKEAMFLFRAAEKNAENEILKIIKLLQIVILGSEFETPDMRMD